MTGSGRRGRTARAALGALLCLLLAAQAGAGLGVFEKKARRKGWEIPKLTTYSFINDSKEAGRLTLVANTEIARFRLEDPYLPVVFVLAVDRGKKLRVTADRFRLALPDGRELEAVPFGEVLGSGYGARLRFDRQLLRGANATGGWFVTRYRYVATRFYPDPSAGEVVVPEVHLYGDTCAMDVVYFPNPGGVAGQVLRLVYEDPEAQPGNRIECSFRIEDPEAPAAKAPKKERAEGEGE